MGIMLLRRVARVRVVRPPAKVGPANIGESDSTRVGSTPGSSNVVAGMKASWLCR
jgi:hypothetical protein